MRKVIFQTGVDVLGFPIYATHYISQNKGFQNKNEKVVSSQTIVKQH